MLPAPRPPPLIIPRAGSRRGTFARPAGAYYIAAPISPRPHRQFEKRGAPCAWPRNVRNPDARPPPPHSNKPATNCSPTSCDAACWKPAQSTRRNGSTTRCCIWPTVTKSWTSRSSPSCASWASGTAVLSWGGTRRWARGPEPARLPPPREPPPAAPHRQPHAAAEAQFRVPPRHASRRGLDAEHCREVPGAVRRLRPDEREPQPRIGSESGAVAGPEQQLRRRLHAHPHHAVQATDRKSTRLNSSHITISYAVFCLKKKKDANNNILINNDNLNSSI